MRNSVQPLRVLLLARYGRSGASSRVRHYSYIEPLSRRGISVDAQYLIDDESLANFYAGRGRRWHRIALAYVQRLALLNKLRRYDVIWIEKEALPSLPFILDGRFYNSRTTATLLDFDDFWIARNQIAGRTVGIAESEVGKLRKAVGAATKVTAANSQLAEAILELTGRQAEILPNHISVADYRDAALLGDESRPDRPLIGWIGTPYTAAHYLPSMVHMLNRLHDEGLSNTVLIGADQAMPAIVARRIPWSFDNEAVSVANLDIGILPLSSSAFDQSKSGWKAYQYMAAGKPVIATRNAFTSDLIKDGVTGFLVDAAGDFEARLRLLLSDADLRSRIGRAAQESIMARYDLESGADKLAAIFRGLAQNHFQKPL